MRFFTNALCVFSLMSPAWGVDFTGSGNSSIVNISTNVPLTTTAGNQQYLLNLHANTNNNDNLRAFVNRKAGGALDWLSAEWYLGRYVDVTNMFQLVWGLDPQGMNFRIGRGYPATSDFLINGNGSVIIGTDPGGAALLRVGGVGYLSNGTSRLTLDPNQVTLDSGSPALQFFENDAGVDGKRWKFQANGGSFTGFTANDSDTVAAQWLNVQRSVNSIFKTTINPNGGAMIVGSDPGGGEAMAFS